MKKTCSIRLVIGIILLTVTLAGCAGFAVGTLKNWNTYEKRIAILEEKNKKLAESKNEKGNVKESLNVVEPYEFILMEENGYVVVYHKDKKTLYASTDILISDLPEKLQKEIEEGKYISSEEQLYNFLENYSS